MASSVALVFFCKIKHFCVILQRFIFIYVTFKPKIKINYLYFIKFNALKAVLRLIINKLRCI